MSRPIEDYEVDSAAVRALEERPSSFASLYAHWERNQWSALELDFSADAEAFARLEREACEGLLWIFAHRFHAEFNVAVLLASLGDIGLRLGLSHERIRQIERDSLKHLATLPEIKAITE